MIPYSKQNINQKDINSVVKVLKSSFLTKGPQIKKFEKKVSSLVNAKYAVGSNSGSSSLHLACLAIGLKKGDLAWTVPNTYAASANCAINCGAKIDFVDIESDTWNISIESLEKKLKLAKKKNKLPKVIIPVHFAGQPYEQKKVWLLSKKYKFKIIEDASHAIGAKHYNEPVGSCKWSHITVFSFHPVKIITTGEGGMSVTNDKIYAQKMRAFRENGIIFDKKSMKKVKNLPWYYEQRFSGYNYRMSDISAALGLSQISRLNNFIKHRNDIAKIYQNLIAEFPINSQKIKKYNRSSFHLFVVQFDLKRTKLNYEKIFKRFRKNNFFVNLHYMPLHLNKFFSKKGFTKGQFPIAEHYGKCSLSIPIYPNLKKKYILKVVRIIKSVFI
jgi:UDP-4-amino-4,6-dideoxy-N-acetyl-beta-L-altrosamine transaminase